MIVRSGASHFQRSLTHSVPLRPQLEHILNCLHFSRTQFPGLAGSPSFILAVAAPPPPELLLLSESPSRRGARFRRSGRPTPVTGMLWLKRQLFPLSQLPFFCQLKQGPGVRRSREIPFRIAGT